MTCIQSWPKIEHVEGVEYSCGKGKASTQLNQEYAVLLYLCMYQLESTPSLVEGPLSNHVTATSLPVTDTLFCVILLS